FSGFEKNEISYTNGSYIVDRANNSMSFKDPNFSFNEFRSNLVARWEYLPGSTIHFVWEHNRSNRDNIYYQSWGSNLNRMFGLPAANTFMMKINYWFNL